VIAVTWQTVRARWSSLVGTFIALALGVALLAMMALTLASTIGAGEGPPRWYTQPDVVVAGAHKVSVVTGSGEDREVESVRTPSSRALPADLPARLATVGTDVVVDYAGYATTTGAGGDTVHPWSAAGLHSYSWTFGGAPSAATDIVLTAPTSHRPGDRISVRTAQGTQTFRVSGVLRTSAPPALYATDRVAAGLADGRITAIVLNGSAERVRAVVADVGLVLTGDDRRDAEPAPDSDQLAAAIALLASSTGTAGFVSVFVVASTFSYAVAARRREFGLLRAAGATPRQVRRLMLGEAVLVGLLAAAAGAALGAALAPRFARWLVGIGFAPANFTAHFILWPLAAAFGVGMLVALTGAWLAGRRAARVRPIEALRETALDQRTMTPARWLVGLIAAGGTVPILIAFAHVASDDTIPLAMVAAMLLVVALAMFAPLLLPPLIAALTAPFAARLGPIGSLAIHSARTAVRRTAATAAPILVTVGIAGATLAALGTFSSATESAARDRIAADAVVVPAAAPGIAGADVAALRNAPGVTAAVPVTDAPVYVRGDTEPEDWTGRYADGPTLPAGLDLPVVAGSLANLTGTGTIAVPEGRWHLGDTAELWLGDSTPVRLKVVAIFARQVDLDQTVLLPWALRDAHTRPLASAVYLRCAQPATIRAIAGAGGGRVVNVADFLSANSAEQDRVNRLGAIAVLGMALLYTGIAIANTLVMATRDRARELALLRLAGTTPLQVVRMVGTEAVLVSVVAVLLAAVVTAVTAVAARAGLAGLAPSVALTVPWRPLAAIALACLMTAVLAATIPAATLVGQGQFRPRE
jgi:putative ABC transport system permease protein